ncbi:replication factor A1 [Nematocida sp. AWRm80]|nr:replication factor A1 [Nematocida sp. AWRm80]
MHIQEARELEPIPGCISKILKGENNSTPLMTMPLIVRVQKIHPEDDSNRIFIEIADGEMEATAITSGSVKEAIKTKEVEVGTTIKIGERSLVKRSDNDIIIYIKSIISRHKPEEWAGALKSPSKRLSYSTEPRKEHKGVISKISDISPLSTDTIQIRVKVVFKTGLKEYQKKDNKAGKLFRISVIDATGRIDMVFFDEQASKFYSQVDLNKTYEIIGGYSKLKNRLLPENASSQTSDYDIIADKTTQILPVECEKELLTLSNIVPLNKISRDNTDQIDTLGVIIKIFPTVQISRRSNGEQISKKELLITDQSLTQMKIVLWDTNVNMECSIGDIIVLQKPGITEYRGEPQLNIRRATAVFINPEITPVFKLKGWYTQNTNKITEILQSTVEPASQETTTPITIEKIQSTAPEYAQITATIMQVANKKPIYYTSCTQPNCNKKVDRQDENTYYCHKCNTTIDTCNYNYLPSMLLGDATGQIWVSGFDSIGQALFHGTKAQEMHEYETEPGEYSPEYYQAIKATIGEDITVTLRGTKKENNDGEQEMRYIVRALKYIDYEEETSKLQRIINQIQAE